MIFRERETERENVCIFGKRTWEREKECLYKVVDGSFSDMSTLVKLFNAEVFFFFFFCCCCCNNKLQFFTLENNI